MRRFLIFPPLLAVWFVAAQFGLIAVSYMFSWIQFEFFRPFTDIWIPPLNIPLASFLPAAKIGVVVGVLFAAVDFTFFRTVGTTSETTLRLIQNLVKSGIVAVALILLCQVASLIFETRFNHRRYHAYSSGLSFSDVIGFIQPLLLLASVLWAMGKTLRTPRKS